MKRNSYPQALKEIIIHEYQTKTARFLAEKYKINQNTITTWIEQHFNKKVHPKTKEEGICPRKDCRVLREFMAFSAKKK